MQTALRRAEAQENQKDTLEIKENPWHEYLHPNNTQGLRPEPAMAQKYKNKTKCGIYNPSEDATDVNRKKSIPGGPPESRNLGLEATRTGIDPFILKR